jgi:hypothetical protein
LDADDLPPGLTRVNIGTNDRPVWRVRRQTPGGDRDVPPIGILFRLNKELARELAGAPGTIRFTVVARRIFAVLRRLAHDPAVMRLLLLVLRQTDVTFIRRLEGVVEDLGWDPDHAARGRDQLGKALEKLRTEGVVVRYEINVECNRVRIERNRDWYTAAPPTPDPQVREVFFGT